MRPALPVLAAVALLAVAPSCAGDGSPDATSSVPVPTGAEPAALDPGDFVTRIDNPYWPLAPGSRWVYRETDGQGGEQRVEVTVTEREKTILGIAATVVHDVVTEDGELVEDTWDWYAQDTSGNVWYLGEDTKEYANGEVVSTEGSWEAGVDGAQAGIVMPAEPRPGLAYRQEYLAGEAEDRARVLRLNGRADVPFGSFDGLVVTEETTPLEPDVLEHKFYAPGIGLVLAVARSGGGGREELVAYEP